ncbi:MAG: tetratricopeptide repeat protein [Gemmatimonadetes bacterium]|nr:tetratricopeptide repeat protein [Gemmatimonadota bacterium]MBT5804543.1 tetratricopeptide repeat protein [Gemmatimonadota bacterium]
MTYRLGNALKAQGEFEAAAHHDYAAKTLDPDNPASYVNLGILLLISERYVQAADYFEQALSADPTHPRRP